MKKSNKDNLNNDIKEFIRKRDAKTKEMEAVSERELRKARKELKNQGIGITKETLVAQVYMNGDAEKLSREELLRKADAYCRSNQKKLLVWSLVGISALNFCVLMLRYVWCIVHLDRVIVNNSAIYIALSLLVPIATWIIMTTEEYFNFHNRKFAILLMAVANGIATLLQPLYTLVWDRLVVNIFKIRITDAMTQNMVINLARLVVVAVLALGVTLLAKIIYPFIFATEAREKLLAFKLKHVADLRKNKEYKYDFSTFKDLKTGKDIIVKEEDRYTQFLALGASGMGKTSMIYEPQIYIDIDRKMTHLEIQQKEVLKMIQKGYVKVVQPFKKFGKKYFECIPEKQEEFDAIFKKYRDCGITVVAPDNSMNENILKYTSARGIWVNNLDPTKKVATHPYERLVGMNPFHLSEGFYSIKPGDEESEEIRTIRIAENANNFADAMLAINEMAATGDPYFMDVNTLVSSNVSTIVMLDASIRGRQADFGDVYDAIVDFSLLGPIIERLENFFSIKLPGHEQTQKKYGRNSNFPSFDDVLKHENEMVEEIYNGLDERTKENPYSKTLISVKTRLYKESKLDEHASGLRNLMSKLLQDPRVRRVLMPKGEIIDFNEIMTNNEITVVNTALEFGNNTSTCFGQLFILNFHSAVLRRHIEDGMTPHFFYEDETARYLANTIDTMVTFYRKYKVSCMFALQSLSQPESSPRTKYLKDTLLSVGTLVVFGRTSSADSKIISEMGGQEEYEMVQKTATRTSLLSENPSSSFSERTTPDQKNTVDPHDVRFRDFQELTVLTIDEGRVMPARLAKAAFVPKRAFETDRQKIERMQKWMMVWKSKFPQKADVLPVDADTVLPPDEQETVAKAVGSRAGKMEMNIKRSASILMGQSLSSENLKQILSANIFPEEVEDEEYEDDFDETYSFVDVSDIQEDQPKNEDMRECQEQSEFFSDGGTIQQEAEAEEEYWEYQKRMQEEAHRKGMII